MIHTGHKVSTFYTENKVLNMQSPSYMFDAIQPFMFHDYNIRGSIVRLHESLITILNQHCYPQSIQIILSQSLLGTILIANFMKLFDKLDLQFQDNNDSLIISRCTHQNCISAMARWDKQQKSPSIYIDQGTMVLNLYRKDDPKTYQSIIPLTSHTLADSFQDYFLQSEQCPTSIWLSSNTEYSTGLILQTLPDNHNDIHPEYNSLSSLNQLSQNINIPLIENNQAMNTSELLSNLFPNASHEIYDSNIVRFGCTCHRDKLLNTIKSMPQDDILYIFNQSKKVVLNCDFCNKEYIFTKEDLESD